MAVFVKYIFQLKFNGCFDDTPGNFRGSGNRRPLTHINLTFFIFIIPLTTFLAFQSLISFDANVFVIYIFDISLEHFNFLNFSFKIGNPTFLNSLLENLLALSKLVRMLAFFQTFDIIIFFIFRIICANTIKLSYKPTFDALLAV